MFNANARSLAGTLALVIVVAFVTAFIAAWAQRLIMGKTYVAVTAGMATITALTVMRARHLQAK